VTTAGRARAALRDAALFDTQWMASAAGHDDVKRTPWMPFPLHDFIALVAEALPESTGDTFLEVGCGPGTRMRLARDIFGLEVTGIDRVPEYVDAALQQGLDAEVADALGWDGYGKFDIVWFNRPFRDPALQRQLEAQVWNDVRPGAVVICANLESPPPRTWWPVLDDREVRRWIAQKPTS
jgi:trans-aconitate methyltransferase